MPGPLEVRIDKWLWAARVYKTRGDALEACRSGHVKIAGLVVKPARPVRPGDTIVARTAGPTRTLLVVGLSERRVGPGLVATLFEDRTPPEELERLRLSLVERVLARPRGAGRPTKRDRRSMERLRDGASDGF